MALKVQVVDSSAPQSVPVSDKTRNEFEALYKELSKKDGQKALLTFDDEKELSTWMDEARAYAKTREPKPLRFRQGPSKNLPANQVWVQITDDLEEGGARNGRSNSR